MDNDTPRTWDRNALSARASPPRRRALWVLLALTVVVAGLAVWWWRPSAPTPVAPVVEDDEDLTSLSIPANPGYLGPQACAACHADRVAAFRETHHYRACRVPRPGDMPPGFAPGQGTYTPRDPGLRFEMTQEGDDFIETAVRVTPSGVERTSSKIGLVYGAGAADEVFHTWHDDGLFQLPVVWLHPQNRWGNISYNRYGTGDLSRPTTTRCLECHNTWFAHVAGTPSDYQRDQCVLGVTCERCHGPGREHVAFHEAHPQAKTGQSIVHPGHLDRQRQLEVCTQCHGNATRPRGPAFSYRPGQPLEDAFRTARTTHAEDDHVANQIKYLQESKCFQKSDMTCTTCHDPHHKTDPVAVEQACLKCHQPADCGAQPRLPAAVRSNCVGCHMPRRVWMNVHFHTEDDQYVPPATRHEHRIAVHPEASQEVLLGWYLTQSDEASRREASRLKQALVEHWLGVADGYRHEYRFLAAIGAMREAVQLDPAPATREKLRDLMAIQSGLESDLVEAQHQMDEHRYDDAIATLNKVLTIKPDLGTAHGKLGTIYATVKKNDLAVEQWRQVGKCSPDDPYGYTMLGWLAYREGRPREALEHYRQADEADPYSAKIAYFQGLALVNLARWPEAGERFRRVLTIDPTQPEACRGLSRALREQGQHAEALRYARRAVQLTHAQNAEVLLELAEAYADLDRFAEARDTAAQAVEMAQKNATELVPQMRSRLEDYRARARR